MSEDSSTLSEIVRSIRQSITYQQLEAVALTIVQNGALDLVELTKKFEAILLGSDSTLELKVNVLEVMSAILLSQQKERYLRHFATRILGFLQRQSINVGENKEMSRRVIDTFKKWKESKLFADSFYKKLRNSANSVFYFNPEESEGPAFKRYSKHFLVEMRDIGKTDFSMALYKSFRLQKEREADVQQLREAMHSVEHSVESEGDNNRKVVALKEKLEVVLDSLMFSLKLNDQGMRKLTEIVSNERRIFQSEEQ